VGAGLSTRRQGLHALQLKSALDNCTMQEFATLCALVLALTLGLHPRGRRCAIFSVRVQLHRRVHHMLTGEYSPHLARRFLEITIPLLQLAMAEYLYNVLLDYFPVECQVLHVTHHHATLASVHCDDFRDKGIETGREEWARVADVAQKSWDRFLRALRVGRDVQPCESSNAGFPPVSGLQHCPAPLTSTSPMQLGDMVNASHDVSSSSSLVPHLVMLRRPALPVNAHTGESVHAISGLRAPISTALYDLRICSTPNLQQLYPTLPKEQLRHVYALHRRVQISWLPPGLAAEQEEALEDAYGASCVSAFAARTLMVCTTCAVEGKVLPLHPPLRYSLQRRCYFCVSCHRKHKSRVGSSAAGRGGETGGASTAAKHAAATVAPPEESSIVAIDMIGKIVHLQATATGPSSALPSKCYVFCIVCRCIHELLDGIQDVCPFSPHSSSPAPAPCHRGGLPGSCSGGTSGGGDNGAGSQAGLGSAYWRNGKKGTSCSICHSKSLMCASDVMARNTMTFTKEDENADSKGRREDAEDVVWYALEKRYFCSRHAPPPGLIRSHLLLDEPQLMQLAMHLENSRTAARSSKRRRMR
jgi:hypothetical protein